MSSFLLRTININKCVIQQYLGPREKHKECVADRRFFVSKRTRFLSSTTTSRKKQHFFFVEGENHDNDDEEEEKKKDSQWT